MNRKWTHHEATRTLIRNCTLYLTIIVSFLPALTLIAVTLIAFISTGGTGNPSDKLYSLPYIHAEIGLSAFRIIFWMFSQMLACRTTMEWIWMLWCINVCLKHEWKSSSETQWFRKRRIFDHMILLEDRLKNVSSYWTFNSIVRLLCAILQIGYFINQIEFVMQQIYTYRSGSYEFILQVLILIIFCLQIPIMFIYSLFPAAFAGYLADTHQEEMIENFKKVVAKFKGKMQMEELSTVIHAINGVASETFKSGILFCGFHITLQRTTIIMTLITYTVAIYASLTF